MSLIFTKFTIIIFIVVGESNHYAVNLNLYTNICQLYFNKTARKNKVYNSVVFKIFTALCSHHHYLCVCTLLPSRV